MKQLISISVLMRRNEHQYLQLIKNIIKNGFKEEGRNGNTLSILGANMRFSLKNNKIPFTTTKKLAWRQCLKELLWFIKGDTNNETLQNQNVKIWNDNASRKFLDSRGLHYLDEDDLGPVYGHQWRFYNAKYSNCYTDYSNNGVDQLQNVIDGIKESKKTGISSRRLILNAWNPEQLDEMALPPCHVLSQYFVQDNKLSCALYQRSGDVGLGIPFNIASYSFLTHILAKHCGLEANEFIHFIGNAHIYEDHVGALWGQSIRKPYDEPTLEIKERYDNIDDYTMNDFKIHNYKHHGKIKMNMRA
jgi:thymidylate synthase